MTYQIPQQLEYQEKIMFGLNFRQLLYAFIFGLIAIILFKLSPNSYVGIGLALIPSFIGVFFIFFNLDRVVKDYYYFLRFREAKKGDKRLKDFIGVKEIINNVIITNKDKKIAIIKVQPINFTIKPENERNAIISSFQRFLNSLDFPTQIIMRTESIDLDDYLNSLKSRVNEIKFKQLFEHYKDHLHEIISNNKIMNRVFYLIVPEQGDIEIQGNICLERFSSLNLKVKRLKDKDLTELLIKFFNGTGGDNLSKAITPDCIKNNIDHLETNGQFYRIIYASGYPRDVESGFLDKIVSSLGDFDLSLHIRPYPIERMLIDINRQLQKQRADLYSLTSKGIANPSLEIQYADTRSTLENLQKGKERLFNVSLYITCKADTLEELKLLTKKVESELNSLMILPRTARLRMIQGFKSTIPLGNDILRETRNITTDGLSAFFPFTSSFLEVDNTGIWLGLNKNNIPIIKDIFKLPNPNGLVLAQSGGGKSYFCKLLITRYLLNGTKVMVIDPQGEYKNLVKYFKGQRIYLSKDSKSIINPLDLMGHDYIEKRLSLMDLMSIMLGDLSEIQKALIDRAITSIYAKKGITENSKTWNYNPPILSDLWDEIRKMESSATQLEKSTLRSIANRLSMYTTGVFKFLNKRTNINFNNRFVCFDIGDMPKQVKPTMMFLVLDYIYTKMKSDLSRKILLIDESWSLLSKAEEAGYIFEIVKTCRKFNLGLLLINQEVEGLLDSKAGKSVLANSAYTMLMRQKPAVIDNICNTFHLSENERAHLLTANIGEGLLIMEDDHSKIKVIASPEEHDLITTNADEIIGAKKLKNQEIECDIDLDEDEGLFKYSDLNKDQIIYLTSRGYKIFSFKSISSGKKEKYLLDKNSHEGPSHFFYTRNIAEYLKKYSENISTFETVKPDITFEINGKKIAIEVETGKVLTHGKKQLLKKIELLKQEYDDWYFFVTNKKFGVKYRKFGKVLEERTFRTQLAKIIEFHKKSATG
jgi:type IV secretory pathway VirB4 component